MPISGRPGDAVRRTVAYRGAVWCGRFIIVWAATWLILLPFFAGAHNGSREKFDRTALVVVLVWLAGGVLLLLMLALL
jgi:hypothetical protein